ncbi:ABC transporter ATP-binding protein [Nocardioides sp. 1609]|uniref:ABC transporter ATP-binding protein n=1 Tax=Nocardioides sp. 1609 TaxID=2508327 RepID=UPI00143016D2|nr:ABC transporter ATP-binding protein [Nocardioides sp. 1609]
MSEPHHLLPIAGPDAVRRRAAALVRQFRGRLVAVVAVHAVAVLCGLLPPALLGLIVDRISAGRGVELPVVVALIAAALVLSAGLAFTATTWAFALGERVFAILRMDFSAALLDLPVRQVEAVDPGDVLSRSTSDMDAISEIVRTGVPETLVGTVSVTMTVAFAFVLDPLVALGCLVGTPFIVISTRWYVRRATTAYAGQLSSRAAAAGAISETVRGHEVVESHDLGAAREEVVRRSIARALDKAGVPIWLEQRWFPVVQLGYNLPVLVVLAWGAYLVRSDQTTIGAVAAIALYMRSVLTPLDDLIYWFGESQSATAAMGRILGVTEAGGDDVRAAKTLDPAHAVELDHVSFAYGTSGDALTDLDLTVRRGERVCVVGASGAGKTTLSMLLAGVLSPRAGAVRVSGRVVLVAQEDHIFHGSLRDNLTLARPEADDGALWRALEHAGADGWVRNLDGGLNIALGGDAHDPTPAQARQLALARLFLHEPEVLLLDEATAGLTEAETKQFETALAVALPGSTVIQVAHDLWAAELADTVVVIDEGRLVESGTHRALLAQAGPYSALHRAWRAADEHLGRMR